VSPGLAGAAGWDVSWRDVSWRGDWRVVAGGTASGRTPYFQAFSGLKPNIRNIIGRCRWGCGWLSGRPEPPGLQRLPDQLLAAVWLHFEVRAHPPELLIALIDQLLERLLAELLELPPQIAFQA
jgi:hypothetical protein